ncbi:ABC transporter permease [Bacillus sp. KH172YL63]|uniref:ABC transporter permease n=1 Tax=Bacillus sp. KH172YL63 TaxID=2709784 RepID=UPI0013E4C13D|nr:ABC transporter permease subunit [Bacillus sp. KH172YL63]BCB04002.1 peptide ABC transporter permease [Bacillus sp. KH172YL63]
MRTFNKHHISISVGVLFIVVLVGWSVIFHLSDGKIPNTFILYDDGGKIIGDAPFPPSADFPFGTDRKGDELLYKVIQGAQYTLGAAIVISLVSFLLSFIIGVAGGFTSLRAKKWTQSVFTAFYFIPQSIIAYNILYPLLWEPPQGFETSFGERVILQVITLAVITAPTTAILLSNETGQILEKEFVTSARVLGGSKFFIFKKHVLPHLKMRLFIIFPKITIQVLLILAHLGFFKLYFGGTDVCYGPFCDPPKPIVQEWASIMSMSFIELSNAWWIFMVPMTFFALTILSLTGIAKGVEGLLEGDGGMAAPVRSGGDEKKIGNAPKKRDFLLVEREFDRGM